MFAGFGLGILANGCLKLTFRTTRPWLRDSRVQPYGDSKITATGYSFPSGHSTFATAIFGGLAWWQKKRHKVIAIIFMAALVLTLFSRNYLGVHTPQDVAVGTLSTVIMMWIANFIEDWTDKNIKRDWIVLACGLIICAVLVMIFQSIQIEAVYDSAGNLVIDPSKMKADSFEGIGFISSFVICRYFERRYFDFDTKLHIKDRFIIGVIALIPLYIWCMNIMTICAPYSRALGRFSTHAGIVIYTFIIVPLIMKKIKLPKWMS